MMKIMFICKNKYISCTFLFIHERNIYKYIYIKSQSQENMYSKCIVDAYEISQLSGCFCEIFKVWA